MQANATTMKGLFHKWLNGFIMASQEWSVFSPCIWRRCRSSSALFKKGEELSSKLEIIFELMSTKCFCKWAEIFLSISFANTTFTVSFPQSCNGLLAGGFCALTQFARFERNHILREVNLRVRDDQRGIFSNFFLKKGITTLDAADKSGIIFSRTPKSL